MSGSPDDLAALLPPVKPWDQRRKSLLPLAGGYERYLDTLAWIVTQCRNGSLDESALVQHYEMQFALARKAAKEQIWSLRRCGLLDSNGGRIGPTALATQWLDTSQPSLVIATMHANVKFVGELLGLIRGPRPASFLLQAAVSGYGLSGWRGQGPINYRLGWLRSAGFAEQLPDRTFQATDAGLAFLQIVELYVPSAEDPESVRKASPSARENSAAGPIAVDDSLSAKSRVSELPADGPQTSPDGPARSAPAEELTGRLKTLASDGKRHIEFEEAVRDAFEFLGFKAEHLGGPGQTDVLLTATRAEGVAEGNLSLDWRYRVTVDSKAATGGRLTSNQVNWPALEKHRKQHDAQFSLLVGPGPAGQLLQFAADQNVGVLDASALSALCEAHASAPLATSAYFALFADSDGNARGGLIDTSVVESARAELVLRQQLMVQAFEAVESIASSFKPPDAGLVHFNLSQVNSGQQISEALIAEALELLATPWLSAIAPVNDESASARYVPAAPGHEVAQRLRWLADAFDEAADDANESSEAR